MSYDLRRIGEDRDDEEVQYEYCSSSSSFSDAESCSSEDEGDQNEFSGCRNSDASVYDFSSLMAQLPNSNRRRGLSQYYEGKSQSFTSLSDVQCLEDLPKRENPCNIKRKMIIKPCKSYADGLCDNPQSRQPSSRGSCGNLMARNSNNGRDLLCSRPPAIPLNKNSRRLS